MRKPEILLIIWFCGCMTLSHAQNNPQNHLTNLTKDKNMQNHFTPEQKNVFSTIEKMVSAFEQKDIEGVLATYEEDAIVMFEPQKPIQGKEALRAIFTQFTGMNPVYTFSGHEIYISGDIATHIAPWSMVGHLPDGSKIEQSGLSIAVLRKQPDGKWLMIQDNPSGQYLLSK